MISGSSGEWIGSIGAGKAAPVATAPAAGSSQGVAGVKESFAEVMRESTQADATQVGAKISAATDLAEKPAVSKALAEATPVVKASIGTLSTAKVPVVTPPAVTPPAAKAPVVNGPIVPLIGVVSKQASTHAKTSATAAAADVEGDAAAEADAAPCTVASLAATIVPVVKVPASDVAVQVQDAVEDAVQGAGPLTGKSAVSALKLPGVGKSAGDEQAKTKTAAASKGAEHSVVRSAQVASVAVSDGGATAAVVSNAVAGDSKPGVTAPVNPAPQAAGASAVGDGDKVAKAKLPEIATAGAVPAVAASDADASSTSGSAATGASSIGILNAPVVSATAQSGVTQVGVVPDAQIHPVSLATSNLAPAPSRDAAVSAGAVASHSQGSGSSELTLSAYDAGKPNQLEVGLQGGAFGWMKIRAEMGSDGEVNAYLRGASTNTTDLLQAQAPKIEAYLGTHDVVVRSVQVEAAQVHAGSATAGFAGDGGLASGGGAAQQQQSGRNGGGPGNSEQSVVESAGVDAVRDGAVAVQMVASQNSVALTGTGNWLSVRA